MLETYCVIAETVSTSLLSSFNTLVLAQERIRIGKELLEAKRMEEVNERKRFVFLVIMSGLSAVFLFLFLFNKMTTYCFCVSV